MTAVPLGVPLRLSLGARRKAVDLATGIPTRKQRRSGRKPARRRRLVGLALPALLWPQLAMAQSAAAPPNAPPNPLASQPPLTVLPTVEVIAATPLLGSGVNPDKVPAERRW